MAWSWLSFFVGFFLGGIVFVGILAIYLRKKAEEMMKNMGNLNLLMQMLKK